MFGVFNIFFDILFKSGYFLLVEQFKVVFDCVNIDLCKFIICMCGFGVIVCIIGVVVLLCGVMQVLVYDGFWLEWGVDI